MKDEKQIITVRAIEKIIKNHVHGIIVLNKSDDLDDIEDCEDRVHLMGVEIAAKLIIDHFQNPSLPTQQEINEQADTESFGAYGISILSDCVRDGFLVGANWAIEKTKSNSVKQK